MRKQSIGFGVVGLAVIVLQFLWVPIIHAQESGLSSDLEIVQFKITSGDQFVTIYNASSDPADLSSYELAYLNADKKPTKTFVFGGELSPGGYLVLSDGQVDVCHLMKVETASMSFSTTGGSVQLWHYEDEFTKVLNSSVAWAKTKKSDTPASTLILPSDDSDFLHSNGDEWLVVRPSSDDDCQLETLQPADETATKVVSFDLLPSNMPPVRYVNNPSNEKVIANRNIGKMAPVINELLPNPASPQSDANDEFIELYNPNKSNFDLTGFQLAFGSSNPRKYTFPEGTLLKPGEFRAFTSGSTSISLSNSEAQAWLLDPNGDIVDQSEPYTSAKDGQAWALNSGKWQWTQSPSPNESNTLTTESGTESKQEDAAKVLGINATSSGTPGATLATSATHPAQLSDAAPLHPLVLAGVGSLAVAYAVYEYRHDIGNTIFKLRRYFKLRREARQ